MGYLHITNLYKDQSIMLFRRCYALEKVHGTSAHILYRDDGADKKELIFSSGGESHTRFVELFDQPKLLAGFASLGAPRVTVYGEAYGGKQQGMKATYGEALRFIVFDIQLGDVWLTVPEMDKVAREALDLEVVPFEEISTDLTELNRVRDQPSQVAVRRGMGTDKPREGVVLRPLVELVRSDGERIITKHKQETFSERATPQKVVKASDLEVLAAATAIAQEWVTPMRLEHVLQKLPEVKDLSGMPLVLRAMVEDVYREAKGEIVESPAARAAIGKRAAQLFKDRLTASIG